MKSIALLLAAATAGTIAVAAMDHTSAKRMTISYMHRTSNCFARQCGKRRMSGESKIGWFPNSQPSSVSERHDWLEQYDRATDARSLGVSHTPGSAMGTRSAC